MRVNILFRIFLVLVMLAVLAGVAIFAYDAGAAHQLAASGNLPSANPGGSPYAFYPGFFFLPFGFPFFGLLFGLGLFLLFGLVLRGLFWRGPRHWHGHYGRWDTNVPPMFEEWHRRAHEAQAKEE